MAPQHSIHVRSRLAAWSALASGGVRFASVALTRAGIITLVLLASQNPGYSEFLLDGSRDNLVVKAEQTPLSDIVDALAKKFDVRLKSQVSLDARVDGRFSGPLTSVLRRLLESYNFVLMQGQNGNGNSIAIIVLNQIDNKPLVLLQPVLVPKIRHSDGGE